jgi:TDG/mug DNA glycosylase family protein
MSVLPDVLQANLAVVFCGTAAGKKSAQVGAYYAGPGNKFWEVLYRIGLTPRKLEPREFRGLLQYGIGLTDIIKEQSGADEAVGVTESDRDDLHARIETYEPRVLAFNGKRSAQEFFMRPLKYGQQPERIGATSVFVLPSTSGAARGFWDLTYWQMLAVFVRNLKEEKPE